MRRGIRLALGLALLAGPLAAMPAEDVPSVDQMFEQARELGFNGHRQEAREICGRILQRSPGYDDVRIFLGRLHAWDKQPEPAREQFLHVLERRPEHLDARRALIDAELWSDNPENALRYSEEGLAYHPGNADLLYRKARALADQERTPEALKVARQAAQADPDSKNARRLVERLRFLVPHYKFSADYTHESFSDDRRDWNDQSFELRRGFKRGSVIGRVNLAHRFGRSAEQYEVDGYPKFGSGKYLYLNAGYSDSRIFPDLRFGAEYFTGMPRSFEGSVGIRYLDFDTSDVTLYTGSLGKYTGNYFVWVRPYFSNKDEGTSYSGQLFIRRYFSSSETYLTLILGAGSSPDEEALVQPDLQRLDSWKAEVEWQKRLGRKWIITGRTGFESEELEADRERDSWRVRFGFERLF